MSDYGRVWEEIKSVRDRLKGMIPESVSSCDSLEETVRYLNKYVQSVQVLLNQWNRLEQRAQLTGDDR